jgi:hypothetical protein
MALKFKHKWKKKLEVGVATKCAACGIEFRLRRSGKAEAHRGVTHREWRSGPGDAWKPERGLRGFMTDRVLKEPFPECWAAPAVKATKSTGFPFDAPKPPHDAADGVAWCCPGAPGELCGAASTLAENAHVHRLQTGHAAPVLKPNPLTVTAKEQPALELSRVHAVLTFAREACRRSMVIASVKYDAELLAAIYAIDSLKLPLRRGERMKPSLDMVVLAKAAGVKL